VSDRDYIRLALMLARRGFGLTSPNPMVGAILVKQGRILGRGWHHGIGQNHAEIEALNDAHRRKCSVQGATLYVTLEPCSTHGRTPPCTEAILAAGIKRVVVGATDPNPRHRGRAFRILKQAGLAVTSEVLASDCERLNEAFNHWIVQRTPLVTVKAAMTLDGKIATASGESKWITSAPARAFAMKLRQGADAILVGINTILADNPALTLRPQPTVTRIRAKQKLRRIVLDSLARTPLEARVVSDPYAEWTTVVVSEAAPKKRVKALAARAHIWFAPLETTCDQRSSTRNLNLGWLLKKLGSEEVTSLLVEGGGEVNASFLMQGLAHRIAFFYAPKILGGRDARKAVAGDGAKGWEEVLRLKDMKWRRVGPDWLLAASTSQM